MGKKYQPKEFEEKWQKVWEKEKIYQTPPLEEKDKKDKKYILAMFPYPSGGSTCWSCSNLYGNRCFSPFF